MPNDTFQMYFMLAIAGGLLTLLGSVGIFISLIIQRRLERLQDILEDFVNLSYRSETNLTGQMYNLIEKYQMNYLLPRHPRMMILRYIDLNTLFILLLWSLTFISQLRTLHSYSSLFFYLVPLFIGIYAINFFRQLLRNTINLENPFLDAIIPNPNKLRSISFLSHFISLSVKSILKQARLSLHLKYFETPGKAPQIKVYLQEELSFDDFFYYLVISSGPTAYFLSYGEIIFNFPADEVTGKPVPVQRNINIPLGSFAPQAFPDMLDTHLLIFTQGEKHPIHYNFKLCPSAEYFFSQSNPEITVNHQIVYCMKDKHITLLGAETDVPLFEQYKCYYQLNRSRYYAERLDGSSLPSLCRVEEDAFID